VTKYKHFEWAQEIAERDPPGGKMTKYKHLPDWAQEIGERAMKVKPWEFDTHDVMNFGVVIRLLQALDEALALNEQLKIGLRQIEYIDYTDFIADLELHNAYAAKWTFCPWCGYKKPDGHYGECIIGNLLDEPPTD